MALLFLEEDPWLLEYESCEKLYRDIMELLTIRQKHPRTSDQYSQLSANVRLRLKQYNNEVSQLNQKLEVTTSSGTITPAESERRTRQLETLHSKAVQIQKIFEDQVLNKRQEDRRLLIGASGSSERGRDRDLEAAGVRSIDDVRAGQKQMLQEQEKGLENLSDIISRQKNIAHTISDEVDFHNGKELLNVIIEILNDISNQVEQTDQRVRTETRHIDVVDNKDKTCIYWVVIILLFISIVVVTAL
ncbi:hypothetical protein NQ318_015517 [Aromia moschata]|uniref:Syntaxin-8 n=1 Tax=Aromia moschata TaxID=1265417 RepID=A0AAV8XQ04_9CUCU|nr:hypothetical protein NQ318_015517 [Aromia moschata]